MPLDTAPYDALLLVSFGGPEKPDDVLPVPGERHPRAAASRASGSRRSASTTSLFGGRSPINDQNRAFIAAVEEDFAATGIDLPVYWGNRNWDPYLADTLAADEGRRRSGGPPAW